jgi:hypothetical protein
VAGVSPAPGLQQVPINALVTVQFNEPVNSQSLTQVTLSANGNPVAVSSGLANGNQTLTLVPQAALQANTLYTLTVTGVTDVAGNPMSGSVTSTFTTGFVDFSMPGVINVSPVNGANGVSASTTVQVQFNKLMNALSITNSTFVIFNGASLVPGTITVSPDGTVATFTPSNPLLTLTTYTVQATSGIIDLEGNALASFQSMFTTQ